MKTKARFAAAFGVLVALAAGQVRGAEPVLTAVPTVVNANIPGGKTIRVTGSITTPAGYSFTQIDLELVQVVGENSVSANPKKIITVTIANLN